MLPSSLALVAESPSRTELALAALGLRVPSLPMFAVGRDLPVVRETHDEALAIQERVLALTTEQMRNATLCQPTQADLDLARERAEALRLYHEYRRRGYSREQASARVRSAHQHRFRLLPTAGQGGGNAIGARNLDNWAKEIRTARGDYDYSDVRALCPRYKKGLRERGGDARFWRFLAAHYLKLGGPSFRECHRLAVADCRLYGVEDVPSEASARRWYDLHVDQASIDIARLGRDVFGDKYQYFIERDWEGVAVNDIWFSDHHDLDCPCHVETEAGLVRPARLTLTAMMDAKSMYIVGWQIQVGAGSNYTIMTSLGLGICRAGLRAPLYLYCDNGADYRALGFDRPVAVGGHEHSVCRQLGMGVCSSLPYRAQAKTIERRFKDVCEWFAKRWAGYLGNRPGTRTAAADYMWQHPELLPSYDELVAEFAIWLDEVYHERPSKGAILRGQCPREAWEGRENMRPAWDRELLREAMLMPRGERTVQQGPCVVLDGHRYYSDLLWPYVGRPGQQGKVMYKIDRWDSSHVYLFQADGRPIGEARLRERIGAFCLDDPDERAKIGEAERIKGHQLRRALTVLETETGGTYRLADPRERILAIVDGARYEMVRTGGRKSVKGGNHQYEHFALAERGEGGNGGEDIERSTSNVQRPTSNGKVAGLVQGGRKEDAERLQAPRRTAAEVRELAEFEADLTRAMDTTSAGGEDGGGISVADFAAAFATTIDKGDSDDDW